MRIVNEYAAVEVELNTEGNGPRLMVKDLSTGKSVFLDPIELQALAWATHKDLAVFARPFFKERAMDQYMARVSRGEAVLEAENILRQMAEPD